MTACRKISLKEAVKTQETENDKEIQKLEKEISIIIKKFHINIK